MEWAIHELGRFTAIQSYESGSSLYVSSFFWAHSESCTFSSVYATSSMSVGSSLRNVCIIRKSSPLKPGTSAPFVLKKENQLWATHVSKLCWPLVICDWPPCSLEGSPRHGKWDKPSGSYSRFGFLESPGLRCNALWTVLYLFSWYAESLWIFPAHILIIPLFQRFVD